MKRGTPEHPKVYTLAAVLNVQRWGAVGILESMWHFAQEYAQAGDVGRHADEAIARAIGWTDNAATLVSGLVQAGWLDRCICHRLRVHDWPGHADQTVQRWLTARNQGFLGCYDDASTILAPSKLPLPLPKPLPEPKPKPKPRAEARKVAEESDTSETRSLIDAYNAVFGTSIGYTPGNLRAAVRALSQGYHLEHCKTVFEAVRERKTTTAQWCWENNREFEYLVRPPYKHHRSQEITQGPLDKIHNELATGRKAS